MMMMLMSLLLQSVQLLPVLLEVVSPVEPEMPILLEVRFPVEPEMSILLVVTLEVGTTVMTNCVDRLRLQILPLPR